jgi:hypothetical protein
VTDDPTAGDAEMVVALDGDYFTHRHYPDALFRGVRPRWYEQHPRSL